MKPDLKDLNVIEFDAKPPEPTVRQKIYKVRYTVLKGPEDHEELVVAETAEEALEKAGAAFLDGDSIIRIDLADIEEVKPEGPVVFTEKENLMNPEEEAVYFEAQCHSAYAAAELLFMAAGGNCAEARSVYEQWCQTDEGKDPKKADFVGQLHCALDAIEHREGQVQKRKAVWTVCDLADAIEQTRG